MPFDIPDNWTWIRFGNLVYIQTGASFKKEEAIQEKKEGYIRVLRGGNIMPFQLLLKSDDLFIPKSLVSDSILLNKNDLITPAVTSLENIGKVTTVNKCLNDVTAGGFVYIFRPNYDLENLSNIIMDFMSSALFQKLMKDITKKSGQAFYNMNKERLKDIYFPLPPLNEQKRIVNKIELLEPLFQEYEKYESELSSLENAFPEKLKKSILQYAIEGKLIKQDPNDEPASVLLERIKTGKEALVKSGKIKRDKNESIIYQGDDKNYYENMPFEIPNNWQWTKVGLISESYIGLTYKPTDVSSDGTIVLRSSNIKNGKLDLEDVVRVKCPIADKLVTSKNDIIICARNGSKKLVGKSAIVNTDDKMTFGAFMAICKTRFYCYVYAFLQSPLFFKQLAETSGTTTINQLTQKAFNSFFLPFPPLVEQHKICNKINRLFSIIDY